MLERLENRILMKVTLTDAGILNIEGTDDNDEIALAAGVDSVLVLFNGKARDFDLADITKIVVDGRDGDDVIRSSVAARLLGNQGNDTIIGSQFNDTILGDLGADALRGGYGNDRMLGDRGRDTLRGDGGDDTLHGGRAEDLFLNGKVADGADRISGGGGIDTSDYSDRRDGVAIDLDGFANDGGRFTGWVIVTQSASNDRSAEDVTPRRFQAENDNVLPNIENLIGSDHDDQLEGGSITNFLSGGKGNDTLSGNRGADVLSGGDGIDAAEYSRVSRDLRITLDDVQDDGALFPSVLDENELVSEFDNVLSDIEEVQCGGGDDLVIGNAQNNSLYGSSGNDTLLGMDGNDTITGSDGRDSITGGIGDDRIVVREEDGPDTIDGGDGNDAAEEFDDDELISIEDTDPPPVPIFVVLFSKGVAHHA